MNPPYLMEILAKIDNISTEKIAKSWLPSNFALPNCGGEKLFIPHEKLSQIYFDDVKKDSSVALFCGYNFCSAVIDNRCVKSILVTNIDDDQDIIEIEANYFIDASGGEICRFNGENGIDFFYGEDPFTRFNEPLMLHTTRYSDKVNYDNLNEPSLFFKVGISDEVERHVNKLPCSIDYKRIFSNVEFIYDGYRVNDWVNPMSGMNISGYSVIERGEDSIYNVAVSCIHNYWNFIRKEIVARHQKNLDLYGFTLADAKLASLTGKGSHASMLGIREAYRINCEYMITENDLSKSIFQFDLNDNIACGCHGIDFHVYGNIDKKEVADFNSRHLRPSGMPYRTLVPKRFDNVLVAGKAFGASHIALSARRVNKDMAQLGWAAGNAIRICLENGRRDTHLSNTEISVLQSEKYTSFLKNINFMRAISNANC